MILTDIHFCNDGKQVLKEHLRTCSICRNSLIELLQSINGLPLLGMFGIDKKQIDSIIDLIIKE
jgi:hypothetical protein